MPVRNSISAAFSAAVTVGFERGAARESANKDPHDKFHDLEKNYNLDINVVEKDGITYISGEIDVYCGMEHSCSKFFETLNDSFERAEGKYEIDLNFNEKDTLWGADIWVTDATTLTGYRKGVHNDLKIIDKVIFSIEDNGTWAYRNKENIWQHEIVHVLGFGHKLNETNSVLSYSENNPGYLNLDEMKEMAKVYK